MKVLTHSSTWGNDMTYSIIDAEFKGVEDYADTILYVVMAKYLPPSDWKLDYLCLGVQNVPVLVASAIFPDDRKYSNWFGQNPLSNIKK